MKRTCTLVSLLLCLTLMLGASAAFAEGWVPEKNISVIVPFGAGDGLDLTSRALLEYCDFPVKTIVENISGGSGTIGIQEAYARPADGYTIAMLSVANALSQPLRELGCQAAEMALRLAKDPTDKPASVIMKTKLIVRHTTAQPR